MNDQTDLLERPDSCGFPPQGATATLVSNGHEILAVPSDDLRKIEQIAVGLAATERECGHCGELFEPRKGSGGKPQRFCSTKCRMAAHAANSDTPTAKTHEPTLPKPTLTLAPTHERLIATAAHPSDEGLDDDFDWRGEDVIIRDQRKTAVYWNNDGEVVIRQRVWDYEDDPCLWFNPAFLPALIRRLQQMVRETES